jgi:hypothetical protein
VSDRAVELFLWLAQTVTPTPTSTETEDFGLLGVSPNVIAVLIPFVGLSIAFLKLYFDERRARRDEQRDRRNEERERQIEERQRQDAIAKSIDAAVDQKIGAMLGATFTNLMHVQQNAQQATERMTAQQTQAEETHKALVTRLEEIGTTLTKANETVVDLDVRLGHADTMMTRVETFQTNAQHQIETSLADAVKAINDLAQRAESDAKVIEDVREEVDIARLAQIQNLQRQVAATEEEIQQAQRVLNRVVRDRSAISHDIASTEDVARIAELQSRERRLYDEQNRLDNEKLTLERVRGYYMLQLELLRPYDAIDDDSDVEDIY